MNRVFLEEFEKLALEKRALIERLVRLGATDIPSTPRLVMRHRDPHELKALQQGVDNWWGSKVTQPIMSGAEKLYLNRLKPGKVRDVATKLTQYMAEDPIGTLAIKVTPIPFPIYAAGKKVVERGIDHVWPLPG
jgi:hypothetical protein